MASVSYPIGGTYAVFASSILVSGHEHTTKIHAFRRIFQFSRPDDRQTFVLQLRLGPPWPFGLFDASVS